MGGWNKSKSILVELILESFLQMLLKSNLFQSSLDIFELIFEVRLMKEGDKLMGPFPNTFSLT
jgi:hypothetical protein